MTDNEKAATFIGWEPDAVDRICEVCGARKSQVEQKWQDGHIFGNGGTLSAPDMSDPRNYMKALEAINAAGHWFPEIMTNGIGWLFRFGRMHAEIVPIINIAKSHKEHGQAATLALAALYDAEHPDEHARVKGG